MPTSKVDHSPWGIFINITFAIWLKSISDRYLIKHTSSVGGH